MKTALDTSVILDVICDDPTWATPSSDALGKALRQGQLILNECVLAEIMPVLETGEIEQFLEDWGIEFIPTTRAAAITAGTMFKTYLERSARPRRVLPDFLIGAHALHCADRLLARDRGYYRDYFKDLQLVSPEQKQAWHHASARSNAAARLRGGRGSCDADPDPVLISHKGTKILGLFYGKSLPPPCTPCLRVRNPPLRCLARRAFFMVQTRVVSGWVDGPPWAARGRRRWKPRINTDPHR